MLYYYIHMLTDVRYKLAQANHENKFLMLQVWSDLSPTFVNVGTSVV